MYTCNECRLLKYGGKSTYLPEDCRILGTDTVLLKNIAAL